MNAGGTMCSGACTLLLVVLGWQQWVTVTMMTISVLSTPRVKHPFLHLVGITAGFLVLWSGGWYTAGVHPWT